MSWFVLSVSCLFIPEAEEGRLLVLYLEYIIPLIAPNTTMSGTIVAAATSPGLRPSPKEPLVEFVGTVEGDPEANVGNAEGELELIGKNDGEDKGDTDCEPDGTVDGESTWSNVGVAEGTEDCGLELVGRYEGVASGVNVGDSEGSNEGEDVGVREDEGEVVWSMPKLTNGKESPISFRLSPRA